MMVWCGQYSAIWEAGEALPYSAILLPHLIWGAARRYGDHVPQTPSLIWWRNAFFLTPKSPKKNAEGSLPLLPYWGKPPNPQWADTATKQARHSSKKTSL